MQTGKRIKIAIPDQNLHPPQLSRTYGIKPEELPHRPGAGEKAAFPCDTTPATDITFHPSLAEPGASSKLFNYKSYAPKLDKYT